MRDRAAAYLEHFDFDFGDEGMVVTLSGEAPEELRHLVRQLAGSEDGSALAGVYEALNLIAEHGSEYVEIDEKVCPMEVYFALVTVLADPEP